MENGWYILILTEVSSSPTPPEAKVDAGAGEEKRGVVVYVYAVNGNDEHLAALENGSFGKYYE
jgi:hypothetical protein